MSNLDTGSDTQGTQPDVLDGIGNAFDTHVDDVVMGDDGRVELVMTPAPDDDTSPASGVDDAAPAGGVPDGFVPEERYKNVQAWATKVTQGQAERDQKIAKLEGALETLLKGQSPDSTEPADKEEIPDFKSNEELVEWIQARDARRESEFNERLENRLGPVESKEQAEQEVREALADPDMPHFRELSVAINEVIMSNPNVDVSMKQAYGEVMAEMPDIIEWGPAVNEVYVRYPKAGLSVRQAYDLAKSMFEIVEDGEPTDPNPNGTPAGLTPTQRRAIEDSSRRLHVEPGHENDDDAPAARQANETLSLDEAMDAGWKDTIGR